MVVKYADNILKNFANALSVILTVIGAAPLFGQYPSPWFIVGAAAVTLSVYMYSQASLAVRVRRLLLGPQSCGNGVDLADVIKRGFCIQPSLGSSASIQYNAPAAAMLPAVRLFGLAFPCPGAASVTKRRPLPSHAQGYETFEACFKSLALRDVLDGGSLARWLSPRRGGAERGEPERWLPRQCGRVAIVCASIAGLMLVIAATQASTQARRHKCKSYAV